MSASRILGHAGPNVAALVAALIAHGCQAPPAPVAAGAPDYQFTWMPEGVFPWSWAGSVLASDGDAAVLIVGAQDEVQAGKWSQARGAASVLPELPPKWVDELGETPRQEPVATGMNDRGTVVGFVLIKGHVGGPGFVWMPEEGLIQFPTDRGVPTDVNEQDQVAGAGAEGVFLWERGTGFLQVKDPRSAGHGKVLLNDRGWIVETSGSLRDGISPFLWKPPQEEVRQLGIPPGFSHARAVAINGEAAVLVNCEAVSPEQAMVRPFLWTEAMGYQPLPAPAGRTHVEGVAMNDRGLILLRAGDLPRPGRADFFLVYAGATVMLPRPGGGTPEYTDMNQRGWLAGYLVPEGPERWNRGFIATPRRPWPPGPGPAGGN